MDGLYRIRTGRGYSPIIPRRLCRISKKRLIGSSLHDLASQVNSWNFPQASLGLAAINAYWNTESVLQEKFGLDTLKSPSDLISKLNAEQIKGSSVASVGHFSIPWINFMRKLQFLR